MNRAETSVVHYRLSGLDERIPEALRQGALPPPPRTPQAILEECPACFRDRRSIFRRSSR
jgi:hypothetical protein